MLPTYYQEFIHLSRYARWDDQLKRRENWEETISRYFTFFKSHLEENHDYRTDLDDQVRLMEMMSNLEVMPSMRCLMTAGRALARDNVAGYNCAYVAVDTPRAFDETMFILMCGTGIGFSVERQFVNKLPAVPEQLEESQTHIIVRDSKRGWASAFKELIALLYSGQIPKWDVSKVRPAGEPLKTMGGRASGPGPLVELFEFTVHLFMNARGRKLTSLECHDLMCKIGEGVVVGGVRRSAMLSLSNLSDQRMRDAKSGAWWEHTKYRELANNSVCYTETPDVGQFMDEWTSLYKSKSGERGIFNREAARIQAMSSGRRKGFWDEGCDDPIAFGTNPCSEIILRPNEFCNLTEAVARPGDDERDLERKVRAAAILGTWQATLTNFRYLTSRWNRNCEEERLLGVSITGIMDSPHLQDPKPELLHHLRDCVNEENRKWSEILGIPVSAASTCVKPSGTVSQLVLSPSGLHAWHDHQYIRRVSQDNKDPMTHFMIDAGFPHEPHVSKPEHMTVFAFPVRAPEGSLIRDDLPAIKHLEVWKKFQDHWCEHKPSITVTVKENEWPSVGAWVWENFDAMSGVSFLPHDGGSYRQAPYESVDEDTILELESQMPAGVDWSGLGEFEQDDQTRHAKELACSAGVCEI